MIRSTLRIAVLLAALITVAAAAASPTSATQRITNGKPAPAAHYTATLRATVALVDVDAPSQYDGQFCGGTLIDDTHVLTAAHCVVTDGIGPYATRRAPSSFAVLAGSRTLNRRSLVRTSLVPVDTIFVNPNYNKATLRWDAAVLRLARPVVGVTPLALLNRGESDGLGIGTASVSATVAGWGDTSPTLDDCCFPADLLTVGVPIHAADACTANLRSSEVVKFDREFQVCAGTLARARIGADTCQGDSGGPLIVDIGGTPRLAGLTSQGVGCGQRYFGVYSSIIGLMGWLEAIPGVVATNTADPSHGPDGTAPAAASAEPVDFTHVRVKVAPRVAGAVPTGYTLWARVNAPDIATDIYLGSFAAADTTIANQYVVTVPPTNDARDYTFVVRPRSVMGDGPMTLFDATPVLDRAAPTRTRVLGIARRSALVTVRWSASADAQGGLGGYYVQRRAIGGAWARPTFVPARTRSLTFRAPAPGHVRVAAEDRAGNLSAYSALARF